MYPVNIDAKRKPVTIIPIGDIHYGNGEFTNFCHVEGFKDFLQWAVKEAEGSKIVFVGLGDFFDIASPSNAVLLQLMYSSVTSELEAQGIKMVNALYRVMSPYAQATKDKKICGVAVKGHHKLDFKYGDYKGLNTDEILMQKLGWDYCGLHQVAIEICNLSKNTRPVNLIATHGSGCGKTINKLRNMNKGFDNADVLIMGHRHQLEVATNPRRNIQGEQLLGRMAFLIAAGTFDKGYDMNARKKAVEHYAETKHYPPNWVGGTIIKVSVGPGGKPRISPIPMVVC